MKAHDNTGDGKVHSISYSNLSSACVTYEYKRPRNFHPYARQAQHGRPGAHHFTFESRPFAGEAVLLSVPACLAKISHVNGLERAELEPEEFLQHREPVDVVEIFVILYWQARIQDFGLGRQMDRYIYSPGDGVFHGET